MAPYTGYNMPDGCSNHDIPGFDIEPESYWPEREEDEEEVSPSGGV